MCVLFIGLYVVSAMRRFWRKELALIWIVTLLAIGVLMWGGVLGLAPVSEDDWGGLPITLILATFGLAFAFPLAILVALGRRSTKLPAVRTLCVLYVELIRGVPLVALLFMASVMFPLFMPEGVNIDKLLRAQIAIILFAAAYLAEVVRGGLQALPKGQGEAPTPRPRLLAKDQSDHFAAGLASGHTAAGEHFHRLLQGHFPGADHWHIRPALHGQGSAQRPALAELFLRDLSDAGGHLHRILLRNVEIQPWAGA